MTKYKENPVLCYSVLKCQKTGMKNTSEKPVSINAEFKELLKHTVGNDNRQLFSKH